VLFSYRLVVRLHASAIRRMCAVMAVASFGVMATLVHPVLEATEGPFGLKRLAALYGPFVVAYAIYIALPWVLIKLTDAEDRAEGL